MYRLWMLSALIAARGGRTAVLGFVRHAPRHHPHCQPPQPPVGSSPGRLVASTAVKIPSSVQSALAEMDGVHEVIDVRSPKEFAEDHIPGAINLPVLSDDQRHEVGVLYKADAFEAKKTGASMVARNIAEHVSGHFTAKEGGYMPLVYCWRGGSRSGSMAVVLAQIGWRVKLLDGGYKAYRKEVIAARDALPQTFDLRVVAGLTGVGKTALLHHLRECGEQVIDLEGLANHRGSTLGAADLPPQPTQKHFESLLVEEMRRFDASKPVFVEAESSKVGDLQVPGSLFGAMKGAPRIAVTLPVAVRVQRILDDYEYWVRNPAELKAVLQRLKKAHGQAVLDEWCALIDGGEWEALVERLLVEHYDVTYSHQASRHRAPSTSVHLEDFSEGQLRAFVDAATSKAIKVGAAPTKSSSSSDKGRGCGCCSDR
jgi:tRNA 2-selenouridine synthase